jgi:hypothetical protein
VLIFYDRHQFLFSARAQPWRRLFNYGTKLRSLHGRPLPYAERETGTRRASTTFTTCRCCGIGGIAAMTHCVHLPRVANVLAWSRPTIDSHLGQ